MNDASTLVPGSYYQPSELLNIFRNFLTHKEINMTLVCLKGVYVKSDKIYGPIAYDHLKDETGSDGITIIVPVALRDTLKNGNLITVYGTLDRKVVPNGYIQILLNVSRLEKVKDIAISEDEIKRAELRRVKEQKGYKNVDSILENILFTNNRPKVALIYADTSIANADFEKGLVAARSHIDFIDIRVSFANTQALKNVLLQADSQKYDVISIVRGGGSGIEKLDEISIIETLANLTTAWIYGVGHEKENLFIKNIADKVIPIPFALGTYFRDIVEAVNEKRNNSRAVLIQEVKKQYEQQIIDSNKKNLDLTKQLEAMQKLHKEQTDASNRQIAQLTKAQKDNQEQLKLQTEALRKANEQTQRQAKEQMDAASKVNADLQKQLEQQGKTLLDMQNQQKVQQTEFNKSLEKMQETNHSLQSSLGKLTAQNTQAVKELSEVKQRNLELSEQLNNTVKNSPMYMVFKTATIVLAILLFILIIFICR